MADAPNMRTFEVACMGGFLLTEDMESLKRLLPRIVTYKNIEDLNEKKSIILQMKRSEKK